MAVLIHRRITQAIKVPDLAEKIQHAQMASGLSVSEVCRRVGISRTYWYKLINNNIPEGLAEPTFHKIEEALGVDLGIKFND